MHSGDTYKAHSRNHEAGNIFFTLFGAVVIVGLLGTIIMATMRGPLTTMVEVQTRTKTEIEMDIASKLVLLEATQLPNDGDCDADGFVEPLEYLDSGGVGPVGGGFLPTVISSSRIDPWGIEYGYCGWDAGAVTNSIGCDNDSSGTNARLDGNGDPSDETYTVIAIISAGPDQIFQTTCSGGASPSITKGGDDVVAQFSYGAAIAATNGLWNIKSGDPSIAEIDKDLEVTGGAAFTGGIDLTASSAALRLGAASMLFPDQTTLSTCNAANNGLVRVNTTPNPDVLELCDSVNGWVSISNGFWSGGAGNDIYYNTGTPQVGIGTTTPASTLEVSGDVSISDVLNVANGFNLTGGDATISNNLGVTGITTLTGTTNAGILNATGAVDFDTTLNVDGSSTLVGQIDAQDSISNSTGDLTLSDAVHVTGGDTTLDNNLIVVGISDLQNTVINSLGDVTLNDDTVVTGTLDAQGAVSNSTGNLTLSDDVDISNDLDVTGDIDGTNISASAALNAGTTVNVNGDQLGPPLTCTSVQKLEWNNGAGWSCVTDLQGGSGGGIPALDDVSDVDAPTPANGDCIVYNNVSGNWESAACAGIAAGVFEIVSNVTRIKASAGTYASDDYVFGSPQLGSDGDPNHDSRMFFDKSKSAFRAGIVSSTEWDDGNVGDFSTALGRSATASGSFGIALGNGSTSSAESAIAIGREINVSGSHALGFGLANMTTSPTVSGNSSVGFMMGDQTNAVDLSAANTFGIFGGRMVIDPAIPATELAPDVHEDAGTLALDVEGYIGAEKYCDVNGNSCFTAASATSSIWTDNTTHVTRENLNVIDTGQTSTTAGLDGDGTRAFYDPNKAALRGGVISGGNTAWQDTSIGINTLGWGENALASGAHGIALGNSTNAVGDYSSSFGWLTMASGAGSTSMGTAVLAGDGVAGSGAGDQSFAIGLGSPAGNFPRVTGARSFVVFMGDQSDVVMSTANTMGIFGGSVVIDPNTPATELAASTAGAQTLELDVEGDIGANNYCDADGNNCFTAATVTSSIWTDNTTHVTRENLNVIDTGQTSTTAGLDGDGTRAFYDPNKAALRGGTISGGNTAWQNANIGTNSLGWGQNTLASGDHSIALGAEVNATGAYAVALGGSGTSAVGNNTIAMGSDNGAASQGSMVIGHDLAAYSGTNALAIGTSTRTSGNYSASLGLGTVAGAAPIVSGNNSLGIFMGDQSGIDVTQANTMAVMGGSLGIGLVSPSYLLHLQDGDLMVGDSADAARKVFLQRNGTTIGKLSTDDTQLTLQALNGNSIKIVPDGGTTDGGITVLDSGFVGISNTAPSVQLDVTGDIEYTGTITDVSDRRLKKDIRPLSDRDSALSQIDRIKTYSFVMKDDPKERTEFGVIAQELEQIFPELVHTADDEMGTKSVNYVGLIAPMIQATKALKAENDALKEKLAASETQQAEMAMALDTIKQDIAHLKAHTGYGIDKANFTLGAILAFLIMIGGFMLSRRAYALKP